MTDTEFGVLFDFARGRRTTRAAQKGGLGTEFYLQGLPFFLYFSFRCWFVIALAGALHVYHGHAYLYEGADSPEWLHVDIDVAQQGKCGCLWTERRRGERPGQDAEGLGRKGSGHSRENLGIVMMMS